MFLSRLRLNVRERAVRWALGDVHALHRAVMRGFADDLAAGAERVLFRLEGEETGRPCLLVQSLTRPDWERLDTSWLEEQAEWREMHLRLEAGQRLAFRLHANPTARRRVGKEPPLHWPPVTKRVGLHTEAEQMAWLARKLEAGGFHLLGATTSRQARAKGVASAETGSSPSRAVTRAAGAADAARAQVLVLDGVRFDGLLEVVQPAAALATVQAGIGSGKGLGFGLLSLALPRAGGGAQG